MFLGLSKKKQLKHHEFLKSCHDDYSLHCNHFRDGQHADQPISPDTLVELVYVSRMCWRAKFDSKVFKDIEYHSTVNNRIYGLTGILCYGNDFFYQCVEGEYRHVIALRNKMCRDPRHKQMHIYALAPIKQRRYRDWTMKPVVLEAWQLGKTQRQYLRPIRNYLPFKPLSWQQDDWDDFNKNITHFDKVINTSVVPKTSTSSIAHTIINKVAPHQAFLFVQVILLALIFISLSAFMFL